jgi:hypothetical protein
LEGHGLAAGVEEANDCMFQRLKDSFARKKTGEKKPAFQRFM